MDNLESLRTEIEAICNNLGTIQQSQASVSDKRASLDDLSRRIGDCISIFEEAGEASSETALHADEVESLVLQEIERVNQNGQSQETGTDGASEEVQNGNVQQITAQLDQLLMQDIEPDEGTTEYWVDGASACLAAALELSPPGSTRHEEIRDLLSAVEGMRPRTPTNERRE